MEPMRRTFRDSLFRRLPLAGLLALAFFLLASLSSSAQTTPAPATANLPAGLPDVLTMPDGAKVTTPAEWQKARAGWQKFFTEQMYGQAPAVPKSMRFVVVDDTPNALAGLATRKQVTILLNGDPAGPAIHLLLYICLLYTSRCV